MESKNVLSLFSLLIVAVVFLSETSTGARIIGGYQPINDPKDPYVVEIGKFAVNEHNKEASTKLVFVEVASGEKQVVNGVNYKLRINAGGVFYQAIVYDKPSEKLRSLTSFKTMN